MRRPGSGRGAEPGARNSLGGDKLTHPIAPATPTINNVEFQLGRVSIGLGNTDHFGHQAFAEAWVEIGPFRFHAFLHQDGRVSVPSSLRNERLRCAIAAELRSRALEYCQQVCGRLTVHEWQQAAERAA